MGQKELSVCLKIVVAVVAVFLLAVCALFVPLLGHEVYLFFAFDAPAKADIYGTAVPVIIWLSAVPGFVSLVLAWRIFSEIGRNNSFCTANAKRLRTISHLALGDTVAYVALTVFVFAVGASHPSILLVLGAVILFGAGATVACAALSHLTQKAADLKADNDLTI